MDKNLTYKDHLLSISQDLYADMLWFIWCAADLAMETDLKYLTEIFDEDESIPVNTELLEAVDDPAVQLLAKWINKLDQTLFSFHNLNLLSIEDITKEERRQEDLVDRTRIVADKYTETVKLAQESMVTMQSEILSAMLLLADHNVSCSHLVVEFENGAPWSIFADTADQNINLLYVLFDEAFTVEAELEHVLMRRNS